MTPIAPHTPPCNAKTRSGKPCRNRSMSNGKCRMHGGKSSGPRKPHRPLRNQNATTHGIYCGQLTLDEIKDLPAIKETIGRVDEEIVLAKVMLKRTMATWKKVIDAGSGDRKVGFECTEMRNRGGKNGEIEATLKRPDFWSIADKCLGRIANLEMTRAALKMEEIETLKTRLTKMIEAAGEFTQ